MGLERLFSKAIEQRQQSVDAEWRQLREQQRKLVDEIGVGFLEGSSVASSRDTTTTNNLVADNTVVAHKVAASDALRNRNISASRISTVLGETQEAVPQTVSLPNRSMANESGTNPSMGSSFESPMEAEQEEATPGAPSTIQGGREAAVALVTVGVILLATLIALIVVLYR